MDGIANVARQQQTQSVETHIKSSELQHNETNQKPKDELLNVEQNNKITSEKQVEDLVEKLNEAMSPMNTSLKFGVDKDDIFYVSVIESKTNEIIRRFPAEKGMEFLPKMQEVSGILFDSKG